MSLMDPTIVSDEPRTLLRRVRGCAFVTDVDGTVLAWSPEAALSLGVREGEVLRRSWLQRLHVAEGDALLEPIRSGGVPAPRPLRVRRPDGVTRTFVAACTVFATDTPGRPWVLVSLHPPAVAAAPPGEAPRGEASPAVRRVGVNLSRRELEVLALLAQGARGERIAEELGIARATVRNHVQRLFRKLDVRSRLEAVARAYREGWV